MPRNRDSSSEDSLELLLDTICNVFGGIIFIAMLVAILTSAVKVDSTPIEETPQPLQAKERAERSELQREILDYENAIKELIKTSETLDSEALRQAWAEHVALSKMQQEAEQKIEQTQQWLAEAKKIEAENKQLQAKQNELETKVETVLYRLVNSKQADPIRLPTARRTTKAQIVLILFKNRIHWVSLGSSGELFPGRKSPDVTISSILVAEKVTPRPGGGFSLAANPMQTRRFAELINASSPQSHYFDLYVFQDSVAQFQQFKAAVLSMGYSYNVHPFEGDGSVLFTASDESWVQ